MIKDEPNPEFLKNTDGSKANQSIIQSFDNFQSSELSQQNTKLFDFGILDEDWDKAKKTQLDQQEFGFELNQNQNTFAKADEFQSFSLGSPEKFSLQQKKQKLQQFYTLSKKKNNKKHVQQTELDELMKFNEQALTSSSDPKRQSLHSTEEDFFSMAQNQENDGTDFSVFDKEEKRMSSSFKKSLLSPRKQFTDNEQNSKNQTQFFQTQSLLQNEEGSGKDKVKVFSMKHINPYLCGVKFGIHLVSITAISIIYGFLSSIIVLILHDFAQFLFVLVEIAGKSQFKTHQSKEEKNKLLSMSDEIEETQSKTEQKRFVSYIKQERNIKRLIMFHTSFKYSMYVSSMSLLGFAIVHITQIDTFFTANYFSLMNWSPIICLILILFVEGWWNMKMAKNIDEILFYENTVLQDIKILNEKERFDHSRDSYEENLWQS